MFRIITLLLVLSYWISYPVLAQLRIERQVTLALTKPQQAFEVINMGKQGILSLLEKSNNSVLITHLDSNLQTIWEEEYPLSIQLATKLYSIQDKQIHFLASQQDTLYQVIVLNLENGDASLINCKNSLDIYNNKFQVNHFVAVGNAFVFGGENENGKPAVLFYHTQKQEFKVLPNVNYLKSKLIEIKGSGTAKIFSVLLMQRGDIYYHVYNEEGKMLDNHIVRPESKESSYKNYYFNAGKSYLKSEQEQYIIGTYATSSIILNAQGVYVASFANHKHQSTTFYSFNYFQNFHNHLDSIKKEKVLSKIKGKGSYKYDYEVLIEKLQELDSHLLLSLKVMKRNYHNTPSQNANVRKHTILRSGSFEKTQEEYHTPPSVANISTTTNANSRRPKPENNNPMFYENRSFFTKKDTTQLSIRPQTNSFYLYYNTVSCILGDDGNLLWDNLFDESSLNLSISAGSTWEGTSAVGYKHGQITNLQFNQNQLFLHTSTQSHPNQPIYKVDTPFTNGLDTKEQIYNWYDDKFLYWKIISEQDKNGFFFKLKILKIKIE
jgi:hypothetical protein